MIINWKDTATGAIFIMIGLWFIVEGMGLEQGTSSRMGPGFFPPILAGILIALGAFIAIRSLGTTGEPFGTVSYRGVLLTLAAPVIFGATVEGLGMVPSLLLTTFCATLASRRMTLPLAAAITLGLVAFSVLVFSYGLGLPVRLFGPWLHF